MLDPQYLSTDAPPGFSEVEVTRVEEEREALLDALPQARLRLGPVRLVVSPDSLASR